MRINDAIKKLKERSKKNYIVFYGDEELLKESGIRAVLDELNIQTPELNLNVFEDRPDSAAVLRAMETLPFLSETRAVIVKGTDMLSAACPTEVSKALEGANMPITNFLIISASGNVDKRKSFVKYVEKNGMLIECQPLKDAELAGYVTQLAEKNNLIITRKNAQLLCELCGGGLHTLSNEMDKLACVCRGNISQADIEKYASRSTQYNVFKVHDYFCAKQPQKAKKLIDQLLDEDPNPIGFITMIANNFKQMLVARACRDAKFPDARVIACICDETGAKEWAARRAVENCKSFTAAKLRQGLIKLSELDFNAKQGGVTLKNDLFALLVAIYNR